MPPDSPTSAKVPEDTGSGRTAAADILGPPLAHDDASGDTGVGAGGRGDPTGADVQGPIRIDVRLDASVAADGSDQREPTRGRKTKREERGEDGGVLRQRTASSRATSSIAAKARPRQPKDSPSARQRPVYIPAQLVPLLDMLQQHDTALPSAKVQHPMARPPVTSRPPSPAADLNFNLGGRTSSERPSGRTLAAPMPTSPQAATEPTRPKNAR